MAQQTVLAVYADRARSQRIGLHGLSRLLWHELDALQEAHHLRVDRFTSAPKAATVDDLEVIPGRLVALELPLRDIGFCCRPGTSSPSWPSRVYASPATEDLAEDAVSWMESARSPPARPGSRRMSRDGPGPSSPCHHRPCPGRSTVLWSDSDTCWNPGTSSEAAYSSGETTLARVVINDLGPRSWSAPGWPSMSARPSPTE